jgi:hypothetical protein
LNCFSNRPRLFFLLYLTFSYHSEFLPNWKILGFFILCTLLRHFIVPDSFFTYSYPDLSHSSASQPPFFQLARRLCLRRNQLFWALVFSFSISSFMHSSPVQLLLSASLPYLFCSTVHSSWSLTSVPDTINVTSSSIRLLHRYRSGRQVSRIILPSAHLGDLQPFTIDPLCQIHQSLGSPVLAPRTRRVSIFGPSSDQFTVQLTLSPTNRGRRSRYPVAGRKGNRFAPSRPGLMA